MASEAFEAAVDAAMLAQGKASVARNNLASDRFEYEEERDIALAAVHVAHGAAVAEAEARGRAAALREVDAAVEALAMRPDVPECAVALDYDGWYVSRSGSNGHPTPTAAILAAIAPLVALAAGAQAGEGAGGS